MRAALSSLEEQRLHSDWSGRYFLKSSFACPEEDEPMMNVLVLYEADRWVVFVFPREKHRPACYTAEGEANLLSSPASVDLGGVFITPVEKDFLKITAEDVAQILSEVCLYATDFHKVRQRIREKI